MKKKNLAGNDIEKIKVDGIGMPPIGIDIVESLQAFIRVVPAKELCRLSRALLKALVNLTANNNKACFIDRAINNLKGLHKLLDDIDNYYDQSDLDGKNSERQLSDR